jgi:hypothetical protein
LDDRRMKVREIADTIGVSKERVGHVYFIWRIEYEKALRKMVATLANNSSSKTYSHENPWTVLGSF